MLRNIASVKWYIPMGHILDLAGGHPGARGLGQDLPPELQAAGATGAKFLDLSTNFVTLGMPGSPDFHGDCRHDPPSGGSPPLSGRPTSPGHPMRISTNFWTNLARKMPVSPELESFSLPEN